MLSAGNAAVNMIPEHKLCVDNKKLEVTFMKERDMNLFALLLLEPIEYLFKGLILEYYSWEKKNQLNYTICSKSISL